MRIWQPKNAVEIDFNTTMVQVKLLYGVKAIRFLQNFNTTMVQVKFVKAFFYFGLESYFNTTMVQVK